MADEPRPRRRGAWEAVAFLEIAALCGFVIAQPVLGATGGSPDFFLFYGATTLDIVALILVFTLAPPAALWALGAAAGLAVPRARRAAHVAIVGALLVLLAIVVGKDLLRLRGLPLVAVALLAGGILAGLYVKLPALGQFLRFAAAGPLVFALVFVFASPSGALVLPAAAPAAGDAVPDAPLAGGDDPAPAHPDVVTILLDELPLAALLDGGGGIDAELYPNLARLAGDAHLFTNATGIAGTTPLAAPAMLTGVNPSERVAPHYSEYPDNLFTLLGPTYDMNVHESITLLCPAGFCPEQHRADRGGLPAVLGESASLLGEIVSPDDSSTNPMEMYEEPTEAQARREQLGAEFRFDQLGANQPARFAAFMERLEPGDQPTLHFVHLVLPHAPWRYLPSGIQYDNPGQLADEGPASGRSEWWLRLSRQRLQLQMSYTDQLVGEVISTLEEHGTYGETALVVTADHGVSLRPRTPARYLPEGADTDQGVLDAAAELLWVPLLVKEPGQRDATTDDRNVLMTDLLPTLADLAGVEVPWETDGVSVLAEPRAGTEKPFWGDDGSRRVVDGAAGMALANQGLRGNEPVAPELLGRSLEEFTVSDGEVVAEVNGLEEFQRTYPERGSVPAFVSGTVPEGVPEGEVVIAVNDRIGAAGTLTDAFQGKRWFAGLVADDGLFVTGPNRLSVLRVTGPGRLERLQLLPAPPAES